jgi:hypothetical protein
VSVAKRAKTPNSPLIKNMPEIARHSELMQQYSDLFPLTRGMARHEKIHAARLICSLVRRCELNMAMDGGVILELDTALSEQQVAELGLVIIHARRQQHPVGGQGRTYLVFCPLSSQEWNAATVPYGEEHEAYSWKRGV